jgi:hypothetical protein
MNGVLLVLILALGAFASSHVKDEVHSQIEIVSFTYIAARTYEVR